MSKIISFLLLLAISVFSQNSFAGQIPPRNGNITINSVGATDRTQGASLSVSSCSFQAADTNAGAVYFGGSTVTNISGSNPGIKLETGDTLSDVQIQNLNMVYVAADNGGDVLKYVCN